MYMSYESFAATYKACFKKIWSSLRQGYAKCSNSEMKMGRNEALVSKEIACCYKVFILRSTVTLWITITKGAGRVMVASHRIGGIRASIGNFMGKPLNLFLKPKAWMNMVPTMMIIRYGLLFLMFSFCPVCLR